MKEKNISLKPKQPRSSIVLYVIAVVVALMGIAYLTSNILMFRETIAHYVTQGYTTSEVIKGLLPSQLLPGIFEPIAMYGGIAALLFISGIINSKLTFIQKASSQDRVVALNTEIAVESETDQQQNGNEFVNEIAHKEINDQASEDLAR